MASQDLIVIRNLAVFAKHGVYPEENVLGQRFFLDIECEADLQAAGLSDDFTQTVNYGDVCDVAVFEAQGGPHNLIEKVAEQIAKMILEKFIRFSSVRIHIRKPAAAIPHNFEFVSVDITRRRKVEVAFSFGSNVGDRASNIRQAINLLCEMDHVEFTELSHFYETAPWGPIEQDSFLNACAIGTTSLSPDELLRRCKAVEIRVGRHRAIRWGPRVVDIDLLSYGTHEIERAGLTIPHKELFNRAFVLIPLAEIAGNLTLGGKNVSDAANALPQTAIDGVVMVRP